MGLMLTIPFLYSTKVPLSDRVSVQTSSLLQASRRIPLDRDIQVRNIMKSEINKLFVFVLSDEFYERFRCKLFTHTVSCQPILGETEVKLLKS